MGILGIDPGLSGALALSYRDGLLYEEMPTIETQLDLQRLAQLLQGFKEHTDVALLEKVSAMPKQGVSSTFKFGRVYGAVEGMLVALGIPYQLVTPQTWMKVMHQGVEADLDSKARSQLAFKRLFPKVDLLTGTRRKKPHEGIVEALLIAEYGRRTLR